VAAGRGRRAAADVALKDVVAWVPFSQSFTPGAHAGNWVAAFFLDIIEGFVFEAVESATKAPHGAQTARWGPETAVSTGRPMTPTGRSCL
jgi:hypothetical protein